MEKTKRTVLQILTCVGLLCVIWGGYFVSVNMINRFREEAKARELGVVVDYSILSEVEEVTKKDGKFLFSGWAMRLNSENVEIQLVLQPTNGLDAEVLFAKSFERREKGSYFVPNWNFGLCGYSANIKEDELKEDVCYEVFIVLTYIEKDGTLRGEYKKKVTTNQFFYDGMLYQYNPQNFTMPEITDDELMTVIDKGSIRLYSEEQHLWVYQYDWKMYFILDSHFGSMRENNIGIPVMPFTSREELLPMGMSGNDHLGFLFEDQIYQREGIGNYQIAVVELPKAYPITYISTGLFDATEKKWIENFYIDIVYE